MCGKNSVVWPEQIGLGQSASLSVQFMERFPDSNLLDKLLLKFNANCSNAMAD